MASKRPAILFEAAAPVPFPQAWGWQRQLQRRLLEDPGAAEALLVVEHEPCYTLGRGASTAHLRFDPQAPPLPLHRIDRGGEVTHHLPGQIVLYPVLDLRRREPDLHRYLRALEEVVLAVLEELGLPGERLAGLTGVWRQGRKVAAIGVGARRWITQHGLALNVSCPLEGYGAIVPCGLAGHAVGRLSDWRPELGPAAVRPLLVAAVAGHFDLALRPPGPTEGLEGW